MTNGNDPTPPNSKAGDATPCNSSIQSCPYAKSLKGMVTEVNWTSGISVSYAKKTVNPPHWKLGDNVHDGAGSNRPGVYLIKGKGVDTLMVKVQITENQNVSGTGTLTGQLGNLAMQGQCPTSIGEHSVNVKIKELPDSVQWYQGDVSWGLEVADLSSTITLDNASRLEVFVILDKPAAYYEPPGVWTEVLRFLCDKVGVVGVKTGAESGSKIAQYCHSSHSLSYDTMRGAPKFGVSNSGGTFMLDNYINKITSVVNCYDQAAGVQSLSGALGIALDWYYLNPYGYINTTNLVGVGSCNNPFYKSNGTTPVIDINDPKRTGFGNHAFDGLAGNVFDSCAGPHLGTETTAQYVTAAIDTTTTKYTGGFKPGKHTDIQTLGGVSKVV